MPQIGSGDCKSNAVVKLKLPIFVRRTPGNGHVCQSSRSSESFHTRYDRCRFDLRFSRFSLTFISRTLDDTSRFTKLKAAELGKRPETLSESLSGSHSRSIPCSHTYRCASSLKSGRHICNATPSSRTFYAFTVSQVLEAESAPGLSDY